MHKKGRYALCAWLNDLKKEAKLYTTVGKNHWMINLLSPITGKGKQQLRHSKHPAGGCQATESHVKGAGAGPTNSERCRLANNPMQGGGSDPYVPLPIEKVITMSVRVK